MRSSHARLEERNYFIFFFRPFFGPSGEPNKSFAVRKSTRRFLHNVTVRNCGRRRVVTVYYNVIIACRVVSTVSRFFSHYGYCVDFNGSIMIVPTRLCVYDLSASRYNYK